MQPSAQLNIYQIKPWLYVGNKKSISQKTFKSLKITAVINLTDETCNYTDNTKSTYVDQSIEVYDRYLPEQELLESEFNKVTIKLFNICNDIDYLKNNGHNILIACHSGRNKSMLSAGYYLIKSGEPYADVISRLEKAYFNDQQIADEAYEKQQNELEQQGAPLATGVELERRLTSAHERAQVRCLTLQSFCKILRLTGGARK